MPRAPRQEGGDAIHHVVAKGSGGEWIVRDDDDRTHLVQSLGRTVVRHTWTCLAYCLLDTHLHVIVATPGANLGRGMQWFLSSYAREFNERHNRQGNLFHTRFYSQRITSDEHLVSALIYVHLNPVRAGVVASADAWRWGSYAASIGASDAPAFLAVDAQLELFDARRESARLRLELAVNERLHRDRQIRGVRHGV